ncbi:pyridoxal phosphate-dependent aminotransferase [Jannaschia pohangensis]|uniref:Aminotransferase n=1 Tax=Jannaschia pohangensis TaxID=390807 RepID=A0A1I3GNB4_9RHOB|nr:aminotransferase class I/II-fold pyridoxal phosphate-dependent enzyme [Jannaschia pohangensis]SFI24965.1 arginine:pyruvate transaminase [Jannaschia pohangensis]
MTRLSTRIQTLTAGGNGWAVYYRAREMKAAGVPVLDLTIGEHDRRTDPAILEVMDASARGGNTGYAHLTGSPALRDTIAARVAARTGVPTTRDNVAVVPGGQFALFAALMAGIDPGDDVLFPDPYYTSYPGTVRSAGGRPVPVPARPEDGFQPRAADLLVACTGAARALLINSPNNPTGAVYSDAVLEGIARVARDRDLWVVSDEVYDTQCWTGPHRSLRSVPGMAERVLVAGSMSKSHAMTGSRIGWLIGPEAVIAGVSALANTTTYGPPGYIQDATLHALTLGEGFEAGVAAPFRRRRDLCLARIAGQQAVGVIPSGGAMYLMLDVRATGLSGVNFALQLLETKHVAVMPGESFGAAAAGHVRLALTLPDDDLLAALDTLLTFAQELSR